MFERFTKKNITTNALLLLIFVTACILMGGMREDHFVLIGVYIISFYAHPFSRKLIIGFSVFIIFWFIYDSMRIFPNYEISPVHIKEPYQIEKKLFGINLDGLLVTPNEFFVGNHNPILDFLSGIFYLNWIPIPLSFALYLFFRNKELFVRYSLAFLLVNLLGFTIYYIYPAAPPWYVQSYGFDLNIGVPGSRAGLARFDELIGIPIFKGIYDKNSNVLAAMPSLHSAYPVVVFIYALKKRMKWVIGLFFLFMLGVWFAAVYSSHHYIIDVLAGIAVATGGVLLFEKLSLKTNFKFKLYKFVDAIT